MPTAVLEPGIELTAIPALQSDATCWGVIQDIAAAQAGTVFVDERGVLQSWGRQHWRTAPAATQVQRTLTAKALTGLTVSRLADRVRNVLRVAVTPLDVTGPALLWQLSEQITIPARGSVRRLVDLGEDQAFQLRTDTTTIPTGGFEGGFRRSGYRASRNPDGSGGEVNNLVMTVSPSADLIVWEVTNPNPWPVTLVSPRGAGYPSTSDGQPSLIIVGRLITTKTVPLDGTSTVDATAVVVEHRWQPSIDVYGERVLAIDANRWIQVTTEGDALAGDMLHDTAWPMPTLSSVEIVGDPSIQLGDRVHLTDTSGITGVDDPYWIVGYRSDFTGGEQPKLAQVVTVRPVAPPGGWILGVPGRSELGITTRL